MPKILLLAFFVSLVHLRAEAGGPRKYVPRPRCANQFIADPAARVREAFADGLDDDDAIIGYVAISQLTMESLVQTGHAPLHQRANVELFEENAKARRAISSRYAGSNLDYSSKAAFKRASEAAYRLTTLGHLATRLRNLGVRRNTQMNEIIARVVDNLLRGPRSAKNKDFLMVSETEIHNAISQAGIAPLNFAGMLAIRPSGIIQKPDNPGVERAYQLFSVLPFRGGYIVGLKPNAIGNARGTNRETWITEISLRTIVGIEPMGEREMNYLKLLSTAQD